MRIERTRERVVAGGSSRAGAVAMRAALGAHLERRGLKHSRQRELVADVFFGAGGHVAVEELIHRVRAQDPRVSVATVYRTMKLLSECGLAVARQFDGGLTRYEPGVGRAHHDHLICTACGDIVEFANPRIEALQARVAASHGFEVESHKLELYGRCQRCRRAPQAGAEEAP
jgi:Fur family ferric uptake transcriptional regulator